MSMRRIKESYWNTRQSVTLLSNDHSHVSWRKIILSFLHRLISHDAFPFTPPHWMRWCLLPFREKQDYLLPHWIGRVVPCRGSGLVKRRRHWVIWLRDCRTGRINRNWHIIRFIFFHRFYTLPRISMFYGPSCSVIVMRLNGNLFPTRDIFRKCRLSTVLPRGGEATLTTSVVVHQLC